MRANQPSTEVSASFDLRGCRSAWDWNLCVLFLAAVALPLARRLSVNRTDDCSSLRTPPPHDCPDCQFVDVASAQPANRVTFDLSGCTCCRTRQMSIRLPIRSRCVYKERPTQNSVSHFPGSRQTMPNPPPKEDVWAFQPIGAPFPENPVKVLGQQNMYVALWYKHGKPIHGRAWNNGGVVECSFPYLKAELTGAKDLGGQIQVLQYKGDHNNLGFWYEWIQYKDRFEKTEDRQMLKCGDSLPIFWKDRKGGPLIGFLDNKTENAAFSHDGVAENITGTALGNMWIIVRNTKGGPPFCECATCPKPPPPPPIPPPGPPPPRVMLNEWMDIRAGDPWPTRTLIKALGKSLDTIPGQNPDQYIALWYQQGEPIMGRVWNENGKIAAAFGWFNNEYKGNVGSIQVLVELSDHVRGFDYSWQPFKTAAIFGEKEWHPVHVDYHKGDISPCVLNLPDGKQILGKVDVRNEKASAAYSGKENIFVGPTVHPFMVLCRKAKAGYKFD